MKSTPRHVLSLLRAPALAGLALLLGGCANYWSARGRDTADLATLTLTTGAGLKLQAGPLQISPVALIADVTGLRGGEWFPPQLAEEQTVFPMDLGVLWWTSAIMVLPDIPRAEERGKEYCAFPAGAKTDGLFDRHAGSVPFVSIPRATWSEEKVKLSRVSAAYWGQVELALALGGGIRVGTNPLEWADFLVGWCGLDLLGDDVAMERAVPASQPVLKVPESDRR